MPRENRKDEQGLLTLSKQGHFWNIGVPSKPILEHWGCKITWALGEQSKQPESGRTENMKFQIMPWRVESIFDEIHMFYGGQQFQVHEPLCA